MIIKIKFTITMVITLVRMLITASSSGFDWIRSVTVNDKFPMFSILTPDDHLGDFPDLDNHEIMTTENNGDRQYNHQDLKYYIDDDESSLMIEAYTYMENYAILSCIRAFIRYI